MLSQAPSAHQQYCSIKSWVAGHLVGNKNAQSELTFDFTILFLRKLQIQNDQLCKQKTGIKCYCCLFCAGSRGS